MALRDRAAAALRVVVRPLARPRPVRTRYDGPKITIDQLETRRKISRQRLPRGSITGIQVRNGVWYPLIRPETQVLLTDIVWIVGAVVDRIVEESVKGGYRFDPKYGAKCPVCGAEYDTEPDVCDTEGCFSTEFDTADPRLLEPVKLLFDRPNWDDDTNRIFKTAQEMLKDAVYYMQSIADWHWEAVFDRGGALSQLWPMNSEFMRQFADPSLTVGRWFCPSCLADPKRGIDKASYDEPLEACPVCDHPLEETAWAQINESEHVTMVWSKKEVLYKQARAHGKRIAGRSKVLRCWAMAQIIRWMELYQWAAYSGNKAPDAIVSVEGMSQAEVDGMVDELEKFKQDHPEYKDIIWLGLGSGAEGGKNLTVTHVLGSLVDTDAVNLTMHYTKAIAMNFGVSPEMIGIQEAGKLGHPEEVLQVSYDTIQEVDADLEEFVNGQVMPFFPGAAKDWVFKMNPPAPRDEKKRSDEALGWVAVIKALQEVGAVAKLDPKVEKDWPIEIEEWKADGAPGGAPLPPGSIRAEDVKPPLPPGSIRAEHVAPPAAEAAPAAAKSRLRPRTKALTPRNLPRPEAPPGIRAFEDQLVARVGRLFDKAVRDIERGRRRAVTRSEAIGILAKILDGLKEGIASQGAKAVLGAYTIGLDAERGEFPAVGFTDHDRQLVTFLEENPDELRGLLSRVIDDAGGVLNREIRASFERGVDTAKAIKAAAEQLAAEKWKVERVVRTETTRIVNRARVAQYEKYAPPDSRYDWIAAQDKRAEAECLKLEAGNPWTLADLKRESKDFVPHPNCRCTVVRHVD